jgi:translation initiation factor eIF-2B subunit beta
VVSTTRWSDATVLIQIIKDLGRRLSAAQPKGELPSFFFFTSCVLTVPRETDSSCTELAVGNIVRRVLKIIKEVVRGELETDDIMNSGSSEESDDGFSDDDEEVNEEDSDREFKSILAQDTDENADHTNEAFPARPKLQTESSMFNLLVDQHSDNVDYSAKSYGMKPLIIQEINEEIIADLETVYKGIADQALEHIHAK